MFIFLIAMMALSVYTRVNQIGKQYLNTDVFSGKLNLETMTTLSYDLLFFLNLCSSPVLQTHARH